MLTVRRTLAAAHLIFAVIAVTAIGVLQHKSTTLQRDNAALALTVSNDSARLDSTRLVSATNAAVAKIAGDSLHIAQRKVVQVAQQADAMDRALTLERRGRYDLALTIDSLHRTFASHTGVTEDTTDHIRRASFEIYDAPYKVALAVALPPVSDSVDAQHPGDTATVALSIRLDPIPVKARISCGPPNSHGIRDAQIEGDTPRWALVHFDDVQQSPDLCASPALIPGTKASGRSLLKFKALVIGGGRVVLPDGTSRWGAFIGSGFAIGST